MKKENIKMKNLLSYWPLSFMFRKIVTAKEEREEWFKCGDTVCFCIHNLNNELVNNDTKGIFINTNVSAVVKTYSKETTWTIQCIDHKTKSKITINTSVNEPKEPLEDQALKRFDFLTKSRLTMHTTRLVLFEKTMKHG